jgi:branched-chain amino acid transport system substrate-binding protein
MLAVGGLIALAAGCESDSAAPAFTPAPTVAPVIHEEDGVLRIGVLIPQDSANADIGDAIGRAVSLAEHQIDDTGGVNGQFIQVLRANESGGGVGVDPAVATLLDAGVDAIVGPASSLDALASLGEIVDAGVVACSPTASAGLLDNFPDKGLFFRTIPSDSLQAVAIADQVNLTGATEATVVYIDDDYGQLFDDAVEAALRGQNIEPSQSVTYTPDNIGIASAAKQVADKGNHVVVVIGDATSGQLMVAAIDSAYPKDPTGVLSPRYVVNDAMRRPPTSAQPMAASLGARIFGISPVAFSSNVDFLADLGTTADNPSPYAANAYDCVNLIALAALAAGGGVTQPAAIAAQIPSVSASGSPCMTFAECSADLLNASNINYDGPGGRLTIGANGDLTDADFDVFGFDEAGRDYSRTIRPATAP